MVTHKALTILELFSVYIVGTPKPNGKNPRHKVVAAPLLLAATRKHCAFLSGRRANSSSARSLLTITDRLALEHELNQRKMYQSINLNPNSDESAKLSVGKRPERERIESQLNKERERLMKPMREKSLKHLGSFNQGGNISPPGVSPLGSDSDRSVSASTRGKKR